MRKFSEADKARLAALAHAGASPMEIARALDRRFSSIWEKLRSMNLPLNRSTKPKSEMAHAPTQPQMLHPDDPGIETGRPFKDKLPRCEQRWKKALAGAPPYG